MIDEPCQRGACHECKSPNCTCGHRKSKIAVRPLTTAERHERVLGLPHPVVVVLPVDELEDVAA